MIKRNTIFLTPKEREEFLLFFEYYDLFQSTSYSKLFYYIYIDRFSYKYLNLAKKLSYSERTIATMVNKIRNFIIAAKKKKQS